MKILFGSQTGTAAMYANLLAKELEAGGWNAEAQDLGEYPSEKLKDEKFVVFVTSCFGKGEPPDSARKLWSYLHDHQRDDERAPLSGVNYAIFGLGNSACASLWGGVYQAVGRGLDRRLEELGAARVCERGEGDDKETMESDWDGWTKEKFVPLLMDPFKDAKAPASEPSPTALKTFTYLPYLLAPKAAEATGLDLHSPIDAKVFSTEELMAPDYSASCKAIELVPPKPLPYVTGDYVGVYPRNRSEVVEAVGKRLGLLLDTPFQYDPSEWKSIANKLPRFYPNPTTIREALTSFCDLTSPPRRVMLKALADYASDPAERAELQMLGNLATEEKQKLVERVYWRTLPELLDMFPSVRLRWEDLFSLLPALKSRYYSISSSPLVRPNTIALTVGRVQRLSPDGKRTIWGVASNFLCDAQINDSVKLFLKPSRFRLPSDPSVPTVLIAAGNGIAPFHAFMQERDYLLDRGVKLADMTLFYGCRYEDKDFLYRKEVTEMAEKGRLRLFVALSHQDPTRMVFAQHRMREQSALLWDLMERRRAAFYVCGHEMLGAGVEEALMEIAREHGKMNKDQAAAYLHALLEQDRYHADVFS